MPLAAPALLLALGAGFGALRLASHSDGGPTLRVGVIQAAVPPRERFQPGSAMRNTHHHVELTRQLVARGPLDLVVWSETAVDDDLDARPELAELLRRTAGEIGAPLVTGAPRSADGRSTNAVVEFDADGLRGAYDKQRLLPFAESDPAWVGFLAPLLGPVTAGAPYAAGREAHVFAGPIPFATPICFEITDASLVRRFRSAGARLLVNLSNDAWFGPTGFAEAHHAHAVFRAVELRSWVVRATNTGISVADRPGGTRARVARRGRSRAASRPRRRGGARDLLRALRERAGRRAPRRGRAAAAAPAAARSAARRGDPVSEAVAGRSRPPALRDSLPLAAGSSRLQPPEVAPTQIGISFESGPAPFFTCSRCSPLAGFAARSTVTSPAAQKAPAGVQLSVPVTARPSTRIVASVRTSIPPSRKGGGLVSVARMRGSAGSSFSTVVFASAGGFSSGCGNAEVP